MYISVSGNIGAGKTTLSHLIANEINWVVNESDMKNPFFSEFFNDMQRWAFQLQMWFLHNRMEWNRDCPNPWIQDRTVEEEAEIIVKNFYALGLLKREEFNLYMRYYKMLRKTAVKPIGIIYLKASVEKLAANIQKRGREGEQSISMEYLSNLNKLYDDWHKGLPMEYPLLTIDIDKHDILEESTQESVLHFVREIIQQHEGHNQ